MFGRLIPRTRGNMRKLEKGGTFFYEGPKGSGKTEALTKSLANIPKSKSVLVLTYRVNLSNTLPQPSKSRLRTVCRSLAVIIYPSVENSTLRVLAPRLLVNRLMLLIDLLYFFLFQDLN